MKDTPIKISEFRQNTKVILDAVKDSDQWIRRGDELFRVQYMGTVFDAKVDDLVRSPAETTPWSKNAEVPKFEDPVIPVQSAEKIASDASVGELECCKHPTRPCKHWVWDTVSGEGYRNTLSGRYREAE